MLGRCGAPEGQGRYFAPGLARRAFGLWRSTRSGACGTRRQVITGGGVTAGIDFALTVLAEIAGEEYAQSVQLSIEYAPAPPFNFGRPELAPAQILAGTQQRYDQVRAARDAAVKRAAARLPETRVSTPDGVDDRRSAGWFQPGPYAGMG